MRKMIWGSNVLAVAVVAAVCVASITATRATGFYGGGGDLPSGEQDEGAMSALIQSVLDDAATEEERELVRVENDRVKTFLANDDYTKATGGFIEAIFKGGTALATMDYSQEPAGLAKAIGDAVVPIIALGLSLIPGVGPIISGVFTGLWSLFSGLFGGGGKKEESQESKMEKMINDAVNKSEARTDEKLKRLLSGSIHGELSRNKYICDKYAIVADNFGQKFKKLDREVNDTYRLEMLMFLDNCDNFLKDTAEAFNHPEFADVLWVPSAITTLARIGFLSDVITYGHALRISEKLLSNYYRELKNDIRHHYSLHAQGMIRRLKTINDTQGLNGEEMAACRMQSEMLYFDRGLYPYGIPKKFLVVTGLDEIVPESVFAMESDSEGKPLTYKHVQILTDLTGQGFRAYVMINCYMGLTIQTLKRSGELYLNHVNYIAGYSYTVRVLYFTELSKRNVGNLTAEKKTLHPRTQGRLFLSEPNVVSVRIYEVANRKKRDVLFEAEATYIYADGCDALPVDEYDAFQPCLSYTTDYVSEGHFVIEDVGTVNVQQTGGGRFQVTSGNSHAKIVGVEFIVRKQMLPEQNPGGLGHLSSANRYIKK